MSEFPKISVIIPVYNVSRELYKVKKIIKHE